MHYHVSRLLLQCMHLLCLMEVLDYRYELQTMWCSSYLWARQVSHCDQLVWLGRLSQDSQFPLTATEMVHWWCLALDSGCAHKHFCICLRLRKDAVPWNKSSVFQYEQILWHKVMLVPPPSRFSPEQRIPQTLRTWVGMLHCDSSIWTHHTDLLMIMEQDSLSRTQYSFTEHWPVPTLLCL